MATIMHITDFIGEIDEWKAKAESYHMMPTHQFGRSWRYIIAKGNVIEGIKAEY